ncbi:MAG: transglutaminase domain-containing protein [Firmicutes bacterium]|nr:transglutaminase domain-containing protein [Bacillota bacterium]
MKILRKYKTNLIVSNIINIVLTVLTSFSIVYALIFTLGFDYSPIKILIFTFFAVIIYSIIFLNKLTLIITGISIGIVACSRLIYLIYKKTLFESLNALLTFLSWNYNYIYGYEGINNTYQDYTALFLIILVSFLVYIFTIKYFNFLVILCGGIIIFVIQWIMEYTISYVSFYLFVFLIIQYYFKYVYSKKGQEPANDYAVSGVFTIYVLPISFAVFIISFALPKSNNPIEWEWLDKQINKVYDFINDNFKYTSYDYFSFNSTGFGQDDDAKLGGKVRIDKTPVLKVETQKRIYLKGACRDFYTGYSWINSNNALNLLEDPSTLFNPDYLREIKNNVVENEHFYEILEPILGLNLFSDNNEPIENFMEENTVNITYLNLRTKTLFTPSKLLKLIFPSTMKPVIYTDNEGIFSSGQKLGKGFQYTLNTYDLKYSDNNFKDILRKSYTGLYNNMLSKYSSVLIKDINGDTIRINFDYIRRLSERAKQIYSKYIQLPEGLPQRVVDLAKAITSEKNNNFDRVKSIEEYLSNNYPYTLKPNPTPRGRDFVDYFLFDLKEGYCTYYATAMVILVRSIGIPARYVEGYMLPPEPVEEKIYEVTNQNAHAWVEVYFEGFGWIPFEPTAPFVYSFYNSSQYTGTISGSFYEDPYYLEYMEMLEMYAPSIFDRLPHLENQEAEDKGMSFGLFLIWTVIALLLILVLLLIINLSRSKYILNRIKRMSPKESVIAIVEHYIKILSAQGYPVAPGETPLEYAERINRYFVFEKYSYKGESIDSFTRRIRDVEELYKHSMFSKVMEIFIFARYSTAEITQNQKETALAFYDKLIAETKDSMGVIKYFIYRYILGRI